MPDVLVYERAPASFAAALAKRGHHIVYRANEANHCPGCGRSQWYIGRMSAECGFCGTAVPLAETYRQESVSSAPRRDASIEVAASSWPTAPWDISIFPTRTIVALSRMPALC